MTGVKAMKGLTRPCADPVDYKRRRGASSSRNRTCAKTGFIVESEILSTYFPHISHEMFLVLVQVSWSTVNRSFPLSELAGLG